MTYFLVVGDHVVKGVVQLVGTLLDLQLLPVDLVLDVVDPLVELGNVHLAVLEPGLSGLVLALQVVDLLNQLLLPLQSLLCGLLQLLHVVADSLQLLLDALQLGLSLSSSSMVTSLLRQVFSTTLMVLRTLSAALEVMASLVTVAHSCSAAFLSSSSMSMILLVRAETSLSTSLN